MDRCIFLSYRREDTAGYAGRLAVDLRSRLEGDTRLVMDVDTFGPGDLFAESIDRALSTCDAVIALIGRHWLEADPSGRRRIDDSEDWVRVELALALRRRIRVIPVLVDDARLPARADLPADLSRLVDHQALELDNATWEGGVERLVRAIVAEGGAGFPVLALSTSRVDFGTVALDEPSPRQSVQLVNRGIGQLNAWASSDLPWLSISNRSDAVDLRIDTSEPGEYAGQVLVRSAGGTATIQVSAAVTAARSRLRPPASSGALGPGERTRPAARLVALGLLVSAVLAELAWAPGIGSTILASRPRLPADTWPTLVWLMPTPLLVVAAWLAAAGRQAGVALGCVGSAIIWVVTSLALVRSQAPWLDTTSHLVTLVLLVPAMVALVIGAPELRAGVHANPWHRSAATVVLLVLAIALRVESGQVGGLVSGSPRGAPSWDGPSVWQGVLVPVILCAPAAILLGSTELARALMTLAWLQVLYPVIVRLLTFQGTVDGGASVAAVLVTDLTFVAGSMCVVRAVRVGQHGSAGAGQSRSTAFST